MSASNCPKPNKYSVQINANQRGNITSCGGGTDRDKPDRQMQIQLTVESRRDKDVADPSLRTGVRFVRIVAKQYP